MPKEPKTKKIQRSVLIHADLHDDFLKVCHKNYQDFTKRVNFLIEKDIKEYKQLNNIA